MKVTLVQVIWLDMEGTAVSLVLLMIEKAIC
jgi:hypothetical protein